MQIGFEGLIILSTVLLLSYLTYNTFFDDNLEAVKSTVDNREYYVQADRADAKEAANLIAEIRQRLIMLVEHVIKAYPSNDSRVILLKENFDPNVLKEGADNS